MLSVDTKCPPNNYNRRLSSQVEEILVTAVSCELKIVRYIQLLYPHIHEQ